MLTLLKPKCSLFTDTACCTECEISNNILCIQHTRLRLGFNRVNFEYVHIVTKKLITMGESLLLFLEVAIDIFKNQFSEVKHHHEKAPVVQKEDSKNQEVFGVGGQNELFLSLEQAHKWFSQATSIAQSMNGYQNSLRLLLLFYGTCHCLVCTLDPPSWSFKKSIVLHCIYKWYFTVNGFSGTFFILVTAGARRWLTRWWWWALNMGRRRRGEGGREENGRKVGEEAKFNFSPQQDWKGWVMTFYTKTTFHFMLS